MGMEGWGSYDTEMNDDLDLKLSVAASVLVEDLCSSESDPSS